MNKRKWREKFYNYDSRRFLKHSPPYYSDKYRKGVMPPAEMWYEKAREIAEGYRQDKKTVKEQQNRTLKGNVENIVIGWMSTETQRRINAMEAALEEMKTRYERQNGMDIYNYIQSRYFEPRHHTKSSAMWLSKTSAKKADEWEYDFLRSVAWFMGWHNPRPDWMPRRLKKQHDNYRRHHSKKSRRK